MKKAVWLIAALALCVFLCACGKSAEVKQTEETIASIGTVTLESAEQIEAAEKLYSGLSAEDKSGVSNYDELLSARNEYNRLYQEAKETEFLRRVSGEWINAADGDTYTLNEDGTGSHDNVSCRYTVNTDEETVTISEGVGRISETIMMLRNDGDREMLVPEFKSCYYVRPAEYDVISKELREETTEVLVSQYAWTGVQSGTNVVNYLGFFEGGTGWLYFSFVNSVIPTSWDFVDNNTVRVELEYDGVLRAITLDVENENGTKQLINGETGEVAYVPKYVLEK